jgi:misacylated tRNA(Ala) deacylase
VSEPLHRSHPYLREHAARIVAIGADGIELDRSAFYPMGGGQAGDAGWLRRADGFELAIADTRKSKAPGAMPDDALHVAAEGQQAALAALRPGDEVTAAIDWARRHRHMRLHTATHLLCALVPHPVNGCSITAGYARLDFDMVEPLDKDALNEGLRELVGRGVAVEADWIADDDLLARPELVRTMSVKPPIGFGRVRLLRIDGVDLQPCGGTHVADTAEIGAVRVVRIEKKSARTRRVILELAE